MRLKITIVYKDKVQNFDQLAQGESADEFRGRALCAANIPEGAEYFCWEQEGHKYSGPVGEHCLGMKRVHHRYASDDRLPSLFILTRGKVYDYREAPHR